MDKTEAALLFECMADDAAHAKEQLLNAEPTALDIFCELYERVASLTEAERDDMVDRATHATIEVFNVCGVTVTEQDYFELNDYLTEMARRVTLVVTTMKR
jgi:hypothetical protein